VKEGKSEKMASLNARTTCKIVNPSPDKNHLIGKRNV